MRRLWGSLATISLMMVAPASAAPKAAAAPPERVEVAPAVVRLNSSRDTRQLVVTGYFRGEPRDLTGAAAYRLVGPPVAGVSGGRVWARRDGQATLIVAMGGREVRVPVVVGRTAAADPVQFRFETLAVLTKSGCSTGSCHGSPHGRGGLSLSLFGYDPAIDRIALTRDGYSRRLSLIDPEESLLLKKPLLEVSHGGGRRFRRGEVGWSVLRRWIAEGASVESAAIECVGIEVLPGPERVLRAPWLRQQLSVLARFSDGSSRDVTSIATYSSSHSSVADVTDSGLVTGSARGQSSVSVRYLEHLKSVHFTVVEQVPGFVWRPEPETNPVDRLVNAKLRQLMYQPSDLAGDAVFLRRVSLDLTGLLPSPEVTRRFLADTAADKRARMVDGLLQSDAHARFWALKLADLIRVHPRRLKDGRAEALSQWLVESFRANAPFDRMVRALLTSSGDPRSNPAAGYYLAMGTPEERTEMTAQVFMGSRLECARCHNHPFENWTMRDYYRIAAVFARTNASERAGVTLATAGETMHPTTREVMTPWAGEAADPAADRRVAFVDWLVRPGNPYFARVEVNRIWAELFGRGIVDPVDDFRSSNPAANSPLLDALAREFEAGGYDRRRIIRMICNSRAYQRSTATNRLNEQDDALFSHARARLLSAEQIRDALTLVTQPEPVPSSLATQRAFPERSPFTTAFGQPQRETACTCERHSEPTLLQALELLNGRTIQLAAEQGASRYEGLDDGAAVTELYLAAYSREPNERERTTAIAHLRGRPNRREALVDLLWTVMNTREFVFQH